MVGEPMGLFIAQCQGALEQVSGYSMAVAGAEFNVAVGLARLEHRVSYITKLGNDPFGRRIVHTMNHNNISTELITFTDERTTGFMLKSMVQEGDPEIFYFRKGSAASTLSSDDVQRLDFSLYDQLHMTGILPALTTGTREATFALLRKAKEEGLQVSFDPNLRPQLWGSQTAMCDCINEIAAHSDILLPGVKEAEILIGETDPVKIARTYRQMGAQAVIVKLADQGAFFADNTTEQFVPGFAVKQIVDTVGAGDGFAAGVLSACKEGLSMADAVLRGNAVGAIQIMSRGDNDGLPTRTQLEAFMQGKENWRVS